MLEMIQAYRKWWVLTAVICAFAMVFADASALPVSLPSIQKQLDVPEDALEWIVNAYLLALAVLIILGGQFSDKYGARNVFLIGTIIFICTSLVCALAPSAEWLIVGRVLQGVGGALMIPSSSPLLRNVVPAREFGKISGIHLSIASVFLMLGPALGGVLVEYLNWRWIFWINLPLAVLGIAITLFAVPKDKVEKRPMEVFDWLGFITLSLFLVGLVFSLMQGAAWGWLNPILMGCYAVSFVSLLIFLWLEPKHPNPFVDLSLFKMGYFPNCIFIMLTMHAVYILTVFFAIYLQYVLQLSPVRAGLIIVCIQVPVLFSSYLAGYLMDRFGPRLPGSIGTLAVSCGCFWIGTFVGRQSVDWLLPGFILFGLGGPFINISMMTMVISSAAANRRGIASGIGNATRQMGATLGLALFGTTIFEVSEHQFKHWLSLLPGTPIQPISVDSILSGFYIPPPTAFGHQLFNAAAHAYTDGFKIGVIIAGSLAFIAFLSVRRMPKVNIFSEKYQASLLEPKENGSGKAVGSLAKES